MSLIADLIFEDILNQEVELKRLSNKISTYLQKNSILLLSGDLGSGKTTFIRYLCEVYGFNTVQSPTYAIHQRYQNTSKTIDHFDLYRMKNADDLVSTGFWDLIQNPDSFIIIEWFEKINDLSWLKAETSKRKLFGLKIQNDSEKRNFKFYSLT